MDLLIIAVLGILAIAAASQLSDRIGVLQFIRSGRVAITRSRVERLSDMLSTIEEEMHQKGGSC